MYFPFPELRKWGKKAAETRRRNCAVLPYIMAQKHRQRGIIQPTEQTERKRQTFTGYGVFLYVPYSHALYQRRSAGGSVIGSRISPPRAFCPTGRSLQS